MQNGWAIPGDIETCCRVHFASGAGYIIIIEKFGIFQRLVQDRIFAHLPCMYVTLSTELIRCAN